MISEYGFWNLTSNSRLWFEFSFCLLVSAFCKFLVQIMTFQAEQSSFCIFGSWAEYKPEILK